MLNNSGQNIQYLDHRTSALAPTVTESTACSTSLASIIKDTIMVYPCDVVLDRDDMTSK